MYKMFVLLLIGSLVLSCSSGTTSTADSFEKPIDEEGGEFVEYNNPPAQGFNLEGSDLLARLLADKCMIAMGGREAWDNTRYISWNFLGRRDHLWDKSTGDVRIEDPANAITILMNIHSREGSIFKNGEPMTDSIDHFLKKGYGWWVNDSYWLVMPFKLKDSGVTLRYAGEGTTKNGKPADVVQLTFDEVGLTPQNIYEVWIDTETKLVSQWAFYPDSSSSEPRFIIPWDDYRQYGDIMLSGKRGNLELSNITVLNTVPDNIFSDYKVML